MKKIFLVILFSSFFIMPSIALQTGEKAVKLNVSRWLKNGPVLLKIDKEVAESRQNNFYVLVLWGSWSPACREAVPMLVYLQKKYKDKGLQIVALSREKVEDVEKFLEDFPQINYAVAVDNKSLTTLHYLGESRILPRIYIINTKNKIVWDGEIADLAMILEKLYSGNYDPSTQEKISHLQQELEVSMRSGQYAETIKLSDKILEIDPKNGFAIRMRMFVHENHREIDKAWDFINRMISRTPKNAMLYYIKLDFISRFQQYDRHVFELAKDIRKNFKDDAKMLSSMAWGMLTRFPFDGDIIMPAAECAQRAVELASGKDDKAFYASCLNTMALVYYRCGLLEKAIDTQREVSRLVKGDKAQDSSKKAENLYNKAFEIGKELSKVKK